MCKSARARRNAALAALLTATAPLAALGWSGARAADVFAGEAIYLEHCTRCHGTRGRPVLPNVPDFYQGDRLNASDGTLVRKIKAGNGLMPSYNRIIKDRDILNVVAYIRTLQR